LAALKARVEKFKSMMTDMKSGERMVDVGGTAKGTIEGDDFAKALLSIWLGAHPPNAELKAGLLGGPCR
jgi:hypothetical protein